MSCWVELGDVAGKCAPALLVASLVWAVLLHPISLHTQSSRGQRGKGPWERGYTDVSQVSFESLILRFKKKKADHTTI